MICGRKESPSTSEGTERETSSPRGGGRGRDPALSSEDAEEKEERLLPQRNTFFSESSRSRPEKKGEGLLLLAIKTRRRGRISLTFCAGKKKGITEYDQRKKKRKKTWSTTDRRRKERLFRRKVKKRIGVLPLSAKKKEGSRALSALALRVGSERGVLLKRERKTADRART